MISVLSPVRMYPVSKRPPLQRNALCISHVQPSPVHTSGQLFTALFFCLLKAFQCYANSMEMDLMGIYTGRFFSTAIRFNN